jgi:hypothetical protein
MKINNKCVKYSSGDTVKFKLKSGEIQEGDVLFIERSLRKDILYIKCSTKLAYKVPEKKIISKVPEKKKICSTTLKTR